MRPLIDIFSRSCRNVAWPRSFVRSPPFPSPVLLLLADLAFAPPFSILRSPRPRSIESFRFLLLLVLFSFFLLGPALAVQRPRTKRAPNICADPRNLTTLIPSKLLPSSFERRNPAVVDCRSYISIVTALLLLVRSSSDEDDAANLKFLGFDETRGREVFRMVVSFRNLNSRRDEDLFRNEEVLGEITKDSGIFIACCCCFFNKYC